MLVPLILAALMAQAGSPARLTQPLQEAAPLVAAYCRLAEIEVPRLEPSVSPIFCSSSEPGVIRFDPARCSANLSRAEFAAAIAREVALLKIYSTQGKSALAARIFGDYSKTLFAQYGSWKQQAWTLAIPLATGYLKKSGVPPAAMLTLFELERSQIGPAEAENFEPWGGTSIDGLLAQVEKELKAGGDPIRRSETSLQFRARIVRDAGRDAYMLLGYRLFELEDAEAATLPDLLPQLNSFLDDGPQILAVGSSANVVSFGGHQITFQGVNGASRAVHAERMLKRAVERYAWLTRA